MFNTFRIKSRIETLISYNPTLVKLMRDLVIPTEMGGYRTETVLVDVMEVLINDTRKNVLSINLNDKGIISNRRGFSMYVITKEPLHINDFFILSGEKYTITYLSIIHKDCYKADLEVELWQE